jgi:hypothetical protein
MKSLAALTAIAFALLLSGAATAMPIADPAATGATAPSAKLDLPSAITLSASRRYAADAGPITLSASPLTLQGPSEGGLSALAIVAIAIGGGVAFAAAGFAGGRITSPRHAHG